MKKAGAILTDAESVWAESELLIKVKEPLEAEYSRMREGQVLYTYLHLAADRVQTEALLAAGCKGVAYETLRDKKGQLPLLKTHERDRRAPGGHRGREVPGKAVRRTGRSDFGRTGRAQGQGRGCWAAASSAPTPAAWRWAWART